MSFYKAIQTSCPLNFFTGLQQIDLDHKNISFSCLVLRQYGNVFPSERKMHHLITTLIHHGCCVTCKCPALGCGKPKTAVFNFSQPTGLVCCPYAAEHNHEVLLSRSHLYLDEKIPSLQHLFTTSLSAIPNKPLV